MDWFDQILAIKRFFRNSKIMNIKPNLEALWWGQKICVFRVPRPTIAWISRPYFFCILKNKLNKTVKNEYNAGSPLTFSLYFSNNDSFWSLKDVFLKKIKFHDFWLQLPVKQSIVEKAKRIVDRPTLLFCPRNPKHTYIFMPYYNLNRDSRI